MRSARVAIVTLAAAAGCMPGVPRVGGVAIAPIAPDRTWHPPPEARVADSLGVAASVPSVLAGRAATLTLADAVDLALRNNPATRASWAQARAAADAYGIARSVLVPTVSGVVSATRAAAAGGGTATGAAGGGSGARTALSSMLDLSYLVLDFGGRSGGVLESRESAFAASYTHNRVVQTTVLQVEQTFFAYAGARTLRDAQRASVAEAQTSYDAARKRDSVGLATITDVLQARTALAQAELQLQAAEAQLQVTRSSLSLALGLPPTAPFDVAASAAEVPVGEIAASVDALIDQALRERPDLQAAHAGAAAAQAAVRVARSAALPALVLSADEGYARSSPASLTGRSYALSLSVQIPLVDGEAHAYSVAAAQAQADAAAAQLAARRQAVATDVYSAYFTLEAATQQVRTSDDLLASASAAMRAARAQYTEGLVQIVDLLTAQAALATARAQQAQARWSWGEALAGLGYAAGALDTGGRAGVPVRRDTTRSTSP